MSDKLDNNFKKANIIIFGPQGSGKGTQAQMLADFLKIPHISTGTIFREIQKESSEFAKLVKNYLDQGNLVPDKYVNKLVVERLKKSDCQRGFILDGYPRNQFQTDFLVKHINIDYVIVLQLSDEEGIFRISKRRMCSQGHSYHPKFAPPKKLGICDICGEKLFQRADDRPAAIKKRLAIYHQETKPIIDFYHDRGVKVLEIDGHPPIEEVGQKIKKKLLIS